MSPRSTHRWKTIASQTITAICLGGCVTSAPIYYLQLEPVSNRIEKEQSDSGNLAAEAQAQYLGEHRGSIEVSVRIRNLSGSELQVDPGRFGARVSWKDSLGKPIEAPAPVLDRLAQIQKVNFERAKVENEPNPHQHSGAGLAAGMLGAVILGAVRVAVGPDRDPQRAEQEERDKEREREQEEETRQRQIAEFENRRAASKVELAAEATYLQEKVWEVSSLKPDETKVRSILIQSHKEGDTLTLDLPLGKAVHRFVFRQSKVRLN